MGILLDTPLLCSPYVIAPALGVVLLGHLLGLVLERVQRRWLPSHEAVLFSLHYPLSCSGSSGCAHAVEFIGSMSHHNPCSLQHLCRVVPLHTLTQLSD